MPLPTVPLAVGTSEVGGEAVPIRSLTRGEALELRAMQGQPDADRRGEVFLISRATGVPEAEAAEWWSASDPIAVQRLVRDIGIVSRLISEDPADPKQPPSASSSRETST